MSNPVVEIKGLRKSFGSLEVLKGVDFNVDESEVVCLIGSSGSGKSTLLRCINLLEKPDDGSIHVFGQNILDVKNVDQYRANVGMCFQQFNLFKNMNVLKNCMVAQQKVLHRSAKDAEEKAHEEFRAYDEEFRKKAEEARQFREHWEKETQWSRYEQESKAGKEADSSEDFGAEDETSAETAESDDA